VEREALALCPARPDAAVAEGELRRFIDAHYEDARLQRALSVAGRPGARGPNVEWLTSLWTGVGPRNAFTHVFCGDEWTRQKLGGLHWLPRYAQLEAEGRVCYRGPVKGGSPRVGGQYLIRFGGVAPWSCAEKAVGGFTADTDPLSLLAVGTRAFARCCSRAGAEGGVYAAPDLGPQRWQVWCGTRDGTFGIDSLYPTDARATCGE
jgi:hypothetical protein